MKTNTKKTQAGNILVIALTITAIAGITLASFLILVQTQNRIIYRSQCWNMALPIVEAGLEEALTHLFSNCQGATQNWTADGWTASEPDLYSKRTVLPDGSDYTVTIDTAAPPEDASPASPVIVCEGHAAHPPLARLSPGVMFATIAGDTSSTGGTTSGNTTSAASTSGRKVRVGTYNPTLFANGLVAKQSMDMHGHNVRTDSFDSSNPLYSTNGMYYPARAKAGGDIAAGGAGITNVSMSLGNANIYGHATTSAGGVIEIGSNGRIGDYSFAGPGVQSPSWTNNDFNAYFPDVKEPFSGGYLSSAPSGAIQVTNEITQTQTNQSATFPGGVLGTTNLVSFTTNYQNTVTVAYPAAGTYLPPVTTNVLSTTNSTAPAAGTYLGGIWTNLTETTSGVFPAAGTYAGTITTNAGTTLITSPTYPAPGTYVGAVTTNSVPMSEKLYPPAAGTYIPGSLTKKGAYYSWLHITGYSYYGPTYTYQRVVDYRYYRIVSYTYAALTGYTYVLTTNVLSVIPSAEEYNYILDTGLYKMPELDGNIIVRGNPTVWVTEGMDLAHMTITPGSCLKVYSSAPRVSITGNGTANQPGYATNFFFFGLPACTRIDFSGNAGFTGCIYAPQAELSLNGGGHDTIDFIGAGVFKTVTMDGHFNFHYDESLKKNGPKRGYVINQWREIKLTDPY